MALNLRKFLEGLRIIPKSGIGTIDAAGEMEVLSSNNKLQYHNGTSKSPVVTEAHSATLTNKTIDGDDNTIQDVGIASLKAVLADANKVIRRDATGVVTSGNTLSNSSQIVTLDSSDTLTNKTLLDSTTIVADSTDPTKQIKFDAAGTTGTSTTLTGSQTVNRVLTFPDATDTLVGRTTSDTLTNKTLTSPVLNTPTADTITGIAGGALTVQSASNQDLSLQAQGTGKVKAELVSFDANTITGDTASALTITTQSNQNLTLTANGTGVVNTTRPLKVSNVLIEDSAADTTSGSGATLATPATSVVRLTNASLASVNMIPAGSDGQQLALLNTTGAAVTFNDETGATAANRIRTGTGAPVTIQTNASIQLVYNGTTSRWMIVGGTGGGGYVVYNSIGSPASITAAGGITTSSDQRQIRFVQGNSAGLTIVSANPQVSAGTIVGQELLIFGSSDANALQLSNGTGLGLNGSITLVNNTTLCLVWNGSVWSELSRNN